MDSHERSPEVLAGPAVDGHQGLSGLPPGTVVVTMPPELDHDNAEQVSLQLAEAFAPGVTVVIADFTPTMFCDSTGLRAMVVAHKHAVTANAAFRVVGPCDRLMACRSTRACLPR